jgi:hypothetical protein
MQPELTWMYYHAAFIDKKWTPLECRMHYTAQSFEVLLRILATQQP